MAGAATDQRVPAANMANWQRAARLWTEGSQAELEEAKLRVKKLKAHEAECREVVSELKSLPLSLHRDIMVPFGKVAMFPGRLVHTNELMVQLGPDVMVERTAAQAAAIISRRREMVQGLLASAEQEAAVLEGRLTSGQQVQGGSGSDDIVDIVEEYDEALHGALEPLPPRGSGTGANGSGGGGSRAVRAAEVGGGRKAGGAEDDEAHERLMRRLDALELQEQEEAAAALQGDDPGRNADTSYAASQPRPPVVLYDPGEGDPDSDDEEEPLAEARPATATTTPVAQDPRACPPMHATASGPSRKPGMKAGFLVGRSSNKQQSAAGLDHPRAREVRGQQPQAEAPHKSEGSPAAFTGRVLERASDTPDAGAATAEAVDSGGHADGGGARPVSKFKQRMMQRRGLDE